MDARSFLLIFQEVLELLVVLDSKVSLVQADQLVSPDLREALVQQDNRDYLVLLVKWVFREVQDPPVPLDSRARKAPKGKQDLLDNRDKLDLAVAPVKQEALDSLDRQVQSTSVFNSVSSVAKSNISFMCIAIHTCFSIFHVC